jgi:hypothetical protein
MNLTAIIALVLAGVRLIESIFQWWNTQETKGALAAIVAIVKNFLLSIETYRKK